MLEYQKHILQKVSFDKKLFERELVKTLKWINPIENKKLEQWAIENFAHLYMDVISKVFRKKSTKDNKQS